MPDWVVDCLENGLEMDSKIVEDGHFAAHRTLEAQQLQPSAVPDSGSMDVRSSAITTCIRNKFGFGQRSALSSFNGYLSVLPMQHQQLMVLQHLRRTSRDMDVSLREMKDILGETTDLQREALKILENTTIEISTLIDNHLIPLIDQLPDITGLDEFVLNLQGFADNTERAVSIFRRVLICIAPATALLLILINWISGIPVLCTMLPSLIICIAHRIGLLPLPHSILGLWILFLLIRICHPWFVKETSENELLIRKIELALDRSREQARGKFGENRFFKFVWKN